jgi:uncharacterized protein (TIGR02996 family)
MWDWLQTDAAPVAPTPPPDAPELHALLAAVREDPDDFAPQLLLADWLDEHGDAFARRCSELLRVQAAVANLVLDDAGPDDQALPELIRRRTALRDPHVPDWLRDREKPTEVAGPGKGRDCCDGWSLALGRWTAYLRPAEVLAPEFLAALAALPGTWLDTLKLNTADTDQLLELARSDLLAEPRRLRLTVPHDAGRGAGAIEALAERPPLPRLRELRLCAPALAGSAVERLAASPVLTTLTALNLVGSHVGNPGARALAASPHLGRLEALALADNDLGPDGLAALLAAPAAAGVARLHLGRNPLGNRGARLLADSPLPRLRRLRLPACYVSGHGAFALAGSPHLGGLELLDLRGNPIKPAGRHALRQRFGGRVLLGKARPPG